MKTKNLNSHEVDQQRREERTRWGKEPRVRFQKEFFDGTLKPFFEEIGQDPHIQTGEIRTLPASLLERVIQSGGQVEIVL